MKEYNVCLCAYHRDDIQCNTSMQSRVNGGQKSLSASNFSKNKFIKFSHISNTESIHFKQKIYFITNIMVTK